MRCFLSMAKVRDFHSANSMKIDAEVKRILLEEVDEKEKYASMIRLFNDARRDVTKQVKNAIKEKGYKITKIADVVGTDAGSLCRKLQKDNACFSMSAQALVKFSHIYMARSCHELLFESKAIITLPRSISVMVKYIMDAPSEQKKDIMAFTRQKYTDALEHGELRTDMSSCELIRERMIELANERYVQPSYLFGYSTPGPVRAALRKILDPEIEQLGNLSTMMYFSAYLGASLDYFFAVDYTQFTEIKLFGDDDSNLITSKRIRDFVSKYLLLPKSSQAEVFSFVMNGYWLHDIPIKEKSSGKRILSPLEYQKGRSLTNYK